MQKCYQGMVKKLTVVSLALFLSSCLATATLQGPPPMTKRSGTAPLAAMIPFKTNEKPVADHMTTTLKNCLADRNIFTFVPQEKVLKAVAESGFDMEQIFGLSDEEYKALAKKLGVKYVIHGAVSVVKSLKFTGWRSDITSITRICDGDTGDTIDDWRTDTSFSFGDNDEVMQSDKMAESAAFHTCSRMLELTY